MSERKAPCTTRATSVRPPKVRLGEVCKEYSSRNKDGAIKVVFSVTNSQGFVPSNEYFNKEVFSKNLTTYKVVKKGMFAYNPSRINVGSVGCYRDDSPVVVSPLYIVFGVDETKVDSRYLLAFLKSERALVQVRNLTSGSVRDSLKFSAFCQLKFPSISLCEQRGTAARLDRICSVIEKRKAQLSQLQQLVKSRFVEMFGDVGRTPNHWPIVSFDDVAEIESGLTTDFMRYSDCPHIGIDSIEKDTGALKGYRTVAEDKLTSGKYYFTDRHIIYSKIRPNLNKVALPTFEGLCSADAYAILPKEGTDRVFFAFVIRSKRFLDYILPLSGRSGMPKVNQTQVRGFCFPLPPLALQREFAAFVEKVDKLAFAVRKSLETAERLYRQQLSEAFS